MEKCFTFWNTKALRVYVWTTSPSYCKSHNTFLNITVGMVRYKVSSFL